MGVRDWFSHTAVDGSAASGQWWSTASFRGHPDEGLFHYRLASAPEDGALIGSWHQIAEPGSAGAWGPFPPHGGRVFDGSSEWGEAPDTGGWGAEW